MVKSRDRREEGRAKYGDARKRAEQNAAGDRTAIKVPEGLKQFSVKKPGSYLLDILPYRVGKHNPYADAGAMFYERTYYVHQNIGANGRPYICPAKTLEKPCPICEFAKKMQQNPGHDKKVLGKLWPKQRQLFLVHDRNDRESGAQLWDISFHLFGKLLDFRINRSRTDSGWDLFYRCDDDDLGFTLDIGFEEKSFEGNKFCEAKSIDFVPRKKPLKPSLLEDLPCLDNLIIPMEYDELKKIFLQAADAGGGDDEDEDEPRRRRSSHDDEDDEEPRGKHRSKDDEDEDDAPRRRPSRDEEEEEDEEDDEPKSKRGKKSSVDEDDEEDDEPKGKSRRAKDDDEDEDDEDDEPKSRKKSSKKKKRDRDEDEDDDDDPI